MSLFTPLPESPPSAQALTRLATELDRLGGKLDRMAETMATKSDLAQYASREMVETRWAEFDRRQTELQTRVAQHDAQLTRGMHDTMTRETRWDWRVISALVAILTFVFGVAGTMLSGTIVGVTVWTLTHR